MNERMLRNFWAKVEKTNGCWNWTAALHEAGYGIFGVEGKKVDRAHRVSWRLHFGEIPKGKFVCHKCDNRKCVKPEHLFIGSNLDNVRDMHAKKRNSPPPPMGGWNRISFSWGIIQRLGFEPDTRIAEELGISKAAVRREREDWGIPPFPCQTKFKKGGPHPRWGLKRKEDK